MAEDHLCRRRPSRYCLCPWGWAVATQSSWERRVDDSGSVVFDVSPARGSITFLVLYAFGLVFATVFFGVIGLVVLLVAECVRV